MSSSPFDTSATVLVLPSPADTFISIKVSRNTLIAVLGSVLLHLLLLYIFAPKLISLGEPIADSPPLEISLQPPQQAAAAVPVPVLPSEEILPPVPPVASKPIKVKPIKSRPPPVKPQDKPENTPVEVVKKSDEAVTKNDDLNKKPTKPAPPPTSPDPLPGEDMQSYIRRQIEAKLAAQGYTPKDAREVMANNSPQSAGDKRDAKIKENLNFDGSNGIFEIRALSERSAQFSFKGWKSNINTARLEIIDVQASGGEDIKRAVIKKMIEIIRRDYSGDFNWDSHRLGRVLVLSARAQDNDALEDFMMSEFFGSGSRFAN